MKAKKKKKKNMECWLKLWSEIRDFTRPITNNSDDYDEKYLKIRFDSDDNLPLIKR